MKCPFPDTVEIEVADALEVDASPWPLPARVKVDCADDVDLAGEERTEAGRQAVGRGVNADDTLPRLEVRPGMAHPARRRRRRPVVLVLLCHCSLPSPLGHQRACATVRLKMEFRRVHVAMVRPGRSRCGRRLLPWRCERSRASLGRFDPEVRELIIVHQWRLGLGLGAFANAAAVSRASS